MCGGGGGGVAQECVVDRDIYAWGCVGMRTGIGRDVGGGGVSIYDKV